MSVSEIKEAVKSLSPAELAEVAAFIAARDGKEWDKQIDRDFAKGGRLYGLVEEAKSDIREGRLRDLP